MALKESQIKMYDHSEVKVRLLKLYLERYLNILNVVAYVDAINVFDLFCGEGIYENGGKGSPIQILEVIKRINATNSTTGKPKKINCLFNDVDLEKIKKLQEEIRNHNLHDNLIGKLEFTNEDYKDLLPKVIQSINKLKKQKAFVFIDPYGYKEIRISHIRDLLSSKSSEVLLFLPTQFMFRFEEKGTPQSLIEFISEIVPKEKWPRSETGIEFINNLNDGFQAALGDDYFVDSFIITRDKNQFFCLFFFTSHIYGFDRMQDAKWEIDEEEGRGWKYEDESDLFNSVEKSANTYIFEKKLLEYLKSYRTNGEIYKFTLHQRHKPAHTNQILLKLQKEKRIIVLNKDGSTGRRSSFYLNYNVYKEEPDKISVKINN